MKNNPDYKIRIVTDNYDELSRMDGIVSKKEHDYYELCSTTICVCSPEHPLAEKHLPIDDVYSSTLILGVDKTPSRKRLEPIFRDNNIVIMCFDNRIEVSNGLTIVKQFIMQNIGIAFLV